MTTLSELHDPSLAYPANLCRSDLIDRVDTRKMIERDHSLHMSDFHDDNGIHSYYTMAQIENWLGY